MGSTRSFEFLVNDDGTRQAFREIWDILDTISEVTGIDDTSDTAISGAMTHAKVMSRVSLRF